MLEENQGKRSLQCTEQAGWVEVPLTEASWRRDDVRGGVSDLWLRALASLNRQRIASRSMGIRHRIP